MSPEARAAMTRNLDVRACRRLFAAVILHRWNVVFRPLQSDSHYDRHRARSWFDSEGFGATCDLAGVDRQAVLEAFQAELARRGMA